MWLDIAVRMIFFEDKNKKNIIHLRYNVEENKILI